MYKQARTEEKAGVLPCREILGFFLLDGTALKDLFYRTLSYRPVLLIEKFNVFGNN